MFRLDRAEKTYRKRTPYLTFGIPPVKRNVETQHFPAEGGNLNEFPCTKGQGSGFLTKGMQWQELQRPEVHPNKH
jgi:hypothetical protein